MGKEGREGGGEELVKMVGKGLRVRKGRGELVKMIGEGRGMGGGRERREGRDG